MPESLKTRIYGEVVHTKEIEDVLIQDKLDIVEITINQLEQAVKNHPAAREGLDRSKGQRDLLLELQKIVNEPQE